ncbi:cation:proton antiporter [Pseudoduganella chitinolytica]|uniref:Cation:proton antiporter n=1 Tax=Pseudoduganella chitinolytica TaxID=34070 RepID=A0ABY8BAG8_9BURK|nr:cation:proton antiporter [Pseudoduganella chitinolytica]WEF32907.1 cation:proton antiporter [Pseudoduganella chitinolytica]
MWIIQLCIIILAAGLCGALAKRLGQSRVVGEIAAGLLLGPPLLGAMGSEAYHAVFSPGAAPIMAKLGELGLVLLMFQLGLHLDLRSLREQRRVRVPVLVALMGIACPFVIGCGIALLSLPVLAVEIAPLPYVLFCGVTLSISAVPVMARIVVDLGMTGTSTAAIALTAATLTDALGWLMLAVVAALSAGVLVWHDILRNVVLLVVFAAVSMLVVRPLWARLFRTAQTPAEVGRLLPAVFCYVMLSAWATSEIGFHSAFGALVAALALRDIPAFSREWSQRVDGFVELILMPVFFAYAGLKADLGSIPSDSFWPWCGLFLLGAIVGKFGGSYWGARMAGVQRHEACMIGSLMNTRGLMELIVLTIGLQLKVLPPAVYTMLVIMALVTTALTVPTLRFLARSKDGVRGAGVRTPAEVP